MSDGPAWEQQDGEPGKAYAAFRLYRDMGPTSRSIAKVAEQRGERGSTSRTSLWSSKWRWVERAAAYDAWVDVIRRDERERGFREEERLRFQQRRELIQSELDISRKALERVKQGLAGPMFRQRIVEDGRVTIIEPTKWTFRDLAAVFVLADRRARLALEMFGDAARAPTPEPEGAGTSDVERYIEGLIKESMEEAETTSGQ